MKRITHKEIEEGNLITDPLQLRVYEWLKQHKNVWFCDGPIYSPITVEGIKHYEMRTEKLCSIKVGDNGWSFQKSFREIRYIIEKELRQCTSTNNILMIYVTPSGLWMESDVIYSPEDFEPHMSILIRWRKIPRANGGYDAEEELSGQLSESFAKGIDKEIVKQLKGENYYDNHKYLLLSM